METIVHADIVLPDQIIQDGAVQIEDEKIVYAGPRETLPFPVGCITDGKGLFAAPGFIDVHCHDGGHYTCEDAPQQVARYHLRHGTTSMLITFSYCLSVEQILQGIDRIKELCAKGEAPNLCGIHLEGPFLNFRFGYPSSQRPKLDAELAQKLLERGEGLIKLMTIAPELPDIRPVMELARQYGVHLSVGHSDANEKQIAAAKEYGLHWAAHHYCASGDYTEKSGVRRVGVDEIVDLDDDIYAEIIPDAAGVHVKPLRIRLCLKCKGIDKVMIITDSCSFDGVAPDDNRSEDLDVNIVGGQINGSRLTMAKACYNMERHTGCSVEEIFRMAASNPARALGIYGQTGSLEAGKDADLILCDRNYNIHAVYIKGKRLFEQSLPL